MSGVSSANSSRSGLIRTFTPLIFVTSIISPHSRPSCLLYSTLQFYHISMETVKHIENFDALFKQKIYTTRKERLPVFRKSLQSFHYLFRLTSSSSNVSDTVMIRLFAWKPRWVVIIVVNSLDKSTLLISR